MMEDLDNVLPIFKLILIGNSDVGKTNIISRYITGKFSESENPTIAVQFFRKKVKHDNIEFWTHLSVYYRGSKGVIIVFDQTNRKSFQAIEYWYEKVKKNISNKFACIMVGNKKDLVDKKEESSSVSTNPLNTKTEQEEIETDGEIVEMEPGEEMRENVPDLEDREENPGEEDRYVVPRDEIEAVARRINCDYFETSALTGEGVDEAFQGLYTKLGAMEVSPVMLFDESERLKESLERKDQNCCTFS